MKERNVTPEQMEHRIGRFKNLDVLASQKTRMPLEVQDIIYARKLMPVVTLDDTAGAKTPFGNVAPIRGAGGMTMTYAVCPPNTGPSLHRHLQTYETFTVIRGRFEFSWGEDGANSVILEPMDVISVPPGVSRAFRNVADAEGVVQVIITGGVHDMNDAEFPAATAEKIKAHGEEYLEQFKNAGLNFTSSEA